MLDFYIIGDDNTTPAHPEKCNLKHAGGLDDKVFNNLKKKGIIDVDFDYYSDFRWKSELIRRIHERIQIRKWSKIVMFKNYYLLL